MTKKTSVKTSKKTAAKPAAQAQKTVNTSGKARQVNTDNVTALPFINMETFTMKPNKNFDKITQDAAAAAQEQFDAMSQAASICAKGFEQWMKACMEMTQETTDELAESAKALMACKTMNEYADAQNKFAQASFEKIMGNATKLSEMSIRLANDSLQPLNEQMNKAIKKASDTMAA